MATGKTAVITGARRGLGYATGRALAAQGHHVVLTARAAEQLDPLRTQIQADGFSAEVGVMDVSSDASVAAFFEAHFAGGGGVDILINNAGAAFADDDTGLPSVETMEAAFAHNALSAYRTAYRVLPRMNERGFGRIVNVSSMMGSLSDMGGGFTAYRASKVAMNGITRTLGHLTKGDVRVNAVCPGWVRTDMGGPNAHRSIEEGIEGIVWAATLPEGGPNGGFFQDGKRIDW